MSLMLNESGHGRDRNPQRLMILFNGFRRYYGVDQSGGGSYGSNLTGIDVDFHFFLSRLLQATDMGAE